MQLVFTDQVFSVPVIRAEDESTTHLLRAFNSTSISIYKCLTKQTGAMPSHLLLSLNADKILKV